MAMGDGHYDGLGTVCCEEEEVEEEKRRNI